MSHISKMMTDTDSIGQTPSSLERNLVSFEMSFGSWLECIVASLVADTDRTCIV